MRALLLILLVPALPPQEAAPVTLEKKARFSALVEELSRATGCRFKIQTGVEDKEVAVAVRKAGLFEALDALCRAHGNAGYFDPHLPGDGEPLPEIPIHAVAWTEYPSSYGGAFKVAATHCVRERLRSEAGERAVVRVHLALLAPPSIPLDHRAGARIDWTFAAARDADGRDVFRPKDADEPVAPFVNLWASIYSSLNLETEAATVREFDLDRGLSLLKGEVSLTIPDTREIEIALVPGREAATPAGRLVVESLQPHGDKEWRTVLKLKEAAPSANLPAALVNYGKMEHDAGWTRLEITGDSLEARGIFMPAKPGWLKIYAREGARTVKVPFEIKDIRFPKK